MATAIQVWLMTKCPICGESYQYLEDGLKPSTCSKFDCAFRFAHPELKKKEDNKRGN